MLVRLIDHLPPTVIPGLSTYQSVMLVGGFLAIVLSYAAGKLTGSAFLRLLMPWAVGFLGLATLYFMFVSDLGDKVADLPALEIRHGHLIGVCRVHETAVEIRDG